MSIGLTFESFFQWEGGEDRQEADGPVADSVFDYTYVVLRVHLHDTFARAKGRAPGTI